MYVHIYVFIPSQLFVLRRFLWQNVPVIGHVKMVCFVSIASLPAVSVGALFPAGHA